MGGSVIFAGEMFERKNRDKGWPEGLERTMTKELSPSDSKKKTL